MCKKRKGCPNTVDKCMRDYINSLSYSLFFKTVACCCGHGKYSPTVICRDINGRVFDLMSDAVIPRKRRFYRKDKQGFYYIPEVKK